jgi:hypothetical protein
MLATGIPVAKITGLATTATSTDAANLTGTLAAARIADAALTIAKTSGLQTSLDGKAFGSKYLRGPSAPLQSLKRAMTLGRDASIGIISDSTGANSPNWVYRLAAMLGTSHPNHRVIFQPWNIGTQKYDAPTVIQSGVGGDRHISYESNSRPATMSSSAKNIANFGGSDLEMQVEASWDSAALVSGWPSAAQRLLVFGNTNGRGWIEVSNGYLSLRWSEDASGATLKEAGVTMTAQLPSGFSADTKYRIKAALDVNNGSGAYVVTFSYSLNAGVTWTQFGSPVTGPSTTVVHDANLTFALGGIDGNAIGRKCKFYFAQIYRGIGGQPILPERIDSWGLSGSESVIGTLSGAPVLYVDNVACSGYGVGTFLSTLAPYHPQAFFNRDRHFWFLSLSHNDNQQGAGWWVNIAELIAAVNSYAPSDPAWVMLTQNPEGSTIPLRDSHHRRTFSIAQFAAAESYTMIDVTRAFDDYTGALDDLVSGVHTTTAGSVLWAELIRDIINDSEP